MDAFKININNSVTDMLAKEMGAARRAASVAYKPVHERAKQLQKILRGRLAAANGEADDLYRALKRLDSERYSGVRREREILRKALSDARKKAESLRGSEKKLNSGLMAFELKKWEIDKKLNALFEQSDLFLGQVDICLQEAENASPKSPESGWQWKSSAIPSAAGHVGHRWASARYGVWGNKVKQSLDHNFAIREYTDRQHADINKAMRKGSDFNFEYQQDYAEHIYRSLKWQPLPEAVTCYRIADRKHIAALGKEGLIPFAEPTDMIDTVIRNGGFLSTFLSPDSSYFKLNKGKKDVFMQIHVPKGSEAAYLSQEGISKYGVGERELLLNKDSMLVVTDAKHVTLSDITGDYADTNKVLYLTCDLLMAGGDDFKLLHELFTEPS